MGEFATQTRGWTPLIDAVVADLGLFPAVVFGVVWRYCQMSDGVCHASLERIAARVGVDRRTVLRHIKALCQAGYLRDMTPNERARPHTYATTGKADLVGIVEAGPGQTDDTPAPGGMTQSHSGSDTESLPGVTQSHSRGDRESHPGVTESHPKRLSKRESKKPEETSNTHGAVPAPRVGDRDDAVDDDPGETVARLARHFARATGLEMPRPRTDKERRAAEVHWLAPLRKLSQLAGSAAAGEQLIDAAVARLREKGCIIKAPISIVGTAMAMAGDLRRRSDRFRRYAGGRGPLMQRRVRSP